MPFHHSHFGALDEDELLIAASESGLMPSDAEDSAELPPLGVAAANIGLEWSSPPCPERSQLDDWLGGRQPRRDCSAFMPTKHSYLVEPSQTPVKSQ